MTQRSITDYFQRQEPSDTDLPTLLERASEAIGYDACPCLAEFEETSFANRLVSKVLPELTFDSKDVGRAFAVCYVEDIGSTVSRSSIETSDIDILVCFEPPDGTYSLSSAKDGPRGSALLYTPREATVVAPMCDPTVAGDGGGSPRHPAAAVTVADGNVTSAGWRAKRSAAVAAAGRIKVQLKRSKHADDDTDDDGTDDDTDTEAVEPSPGRRAASGSGPFHSSSLENPDECCSNCTSSDDDDDYEGSSLDADGVDEACQPKPCLISLLDIKTAMSETLREQLRTPKVHIEEKTRGVKLTYSASKRAPSLKFDISFIIMNNEKNSFTVTPKGLFQERKCAISIPILDDTQALMVKVLKKLHAHLKLHRRYSMSIYEAAVLKVLPRHHGLEPTVKRTDADDWLESLLKALKAVAADMTAARRERKVCRPSMASRRLCFVLSWYPH